MSLLIQAQTSEDDNEILECLELVLNSASLGLIHESVDVNHLAAYTREFRSSSKRRVKSELLTYSAQGAGSHVREIILFPYVGRHDVC